jgi:gamma-glutamyl hercynylcysteine S-oxide synthase
MPATYSQDAPAGEPAGGETAELSSPQSAAAGEPSDAQDTAAREPSDAQSAAAGVLSDAQSATAALRAARRGTLQLVAHLSEDELEHQQSPIMSPLVWDLAHIAAYEDLWLAHRYAGLELLRPDLAELYDAFETPRAKRGAIELLNTAQAKAYMEDVDERIAVAIAREGVGDGVLHEMVVRHELQHTETMRQTMAMVGLLPPGEPPRSARESADGWTELPAGAFAMGAGGEGFAYDNERPRHMRETGAFRIARRPVSKASWMQFSEGGGYERREWWSDEGWAWKEQYDITHHPDAATGDPRAPVCHVGWFEADAFARAHEARLPTEAEWERAATWEQRMLADVGQVWEWTSTSFHGYPGFRAFPYREYSEVFFGQRYRVLRGGSWASSPRVATGTFRNWDLPERRQIFSGLRLARDV